MVLAALRTWGHDIETEDKMGVGMQVLLPFWAFRVFLTTTQSPTRSDQV